MKNKKRYFELIEQRPEVFNNRGAAMKIVKNVRQIEKYEAENGCEIGVHYESQYHILVVDLVRGRDGKLFPYERMLTSKPGAVIIVPTYEGNYLLVHEFRHSTRKYEWKFPAGFMESDESLYDAANRELREETGEKAFRVDEIGKTVLDSGICGEYVYAVEAYLKESDTLDAALDEVKRYQHCRLDFTNSDVEGTESFNEMMLVSPGYLRGMIDSGKITDGTTLAGLSLDRERYVKTPKW